jgi:hypothetical protein
MKKRISWFKRRKLRKQIEIEMAETMCTLCLYLNEQSRRSMPHGMAYDMYFMSHFRKLKQISTTLREEKG